MKTDRVIELGNYKEGAWKSPQCGRVYSIEGCSPTINTCGGGDRQPKILEVYEGDLRTESE